MLKCEKRRFRQTDAVLAGDGAVERDDGLHHAPNRRLRRRAFPRVRPVIHDVNVQIPVGRVSENRRRQPRFRRDFPHRFQQRNEISRGNADVFVEFGVRQKKHRLRANAASLPKRFRLRRVARLAKLRRVPARPSAHALRLRGDGRRVAVDFDEQHGGFLPEKLFPAVSLRAADGQRIQKFAHGRHDALAQQRFRRAQRRRVAVERAQKRAPRFRERREPQQRARDDAERPLRADPQVAQVVAADELFHGSAPAHFFARRQKAFQRDHVVARHAVFRGAQTAGVRRDVPADRAEFHARGIGRIKQTELRRLVADAPGDDAGLRVGRARRRIDFKPRPMREGKRPAAADGRRRAGRSRSRAAHRHGNAARASRAQHGADVVFVARKHDGVRHEGQPRVVERGGEARGLVRADDVAPERVFQRFRRCGKICHAQKMRRRRGNVKSNKARRTAPRRRPIFFAFPRGGK